MLNSYLVKNERRFEIVLFIKYVCLKYNIISLEIMLNSYTVKNLTPFEIFLFIKYVCTKVCEIYRVSIYLAAKL